MKKNLLHLDANQIADDYASASYFQCIDSEENRRFCRQVSNQIGPERVLTDSMEAAYMGVKLWAAAANEAKSLDTRAVRQAMRAIRLPSPAGETRITRRRSMHSGRHESDESRAMGSFRLFGRRGANRAEPYPIERSAEEWRAKLNDLKRSWKASGRRRTTNRCRS